jgi:hypothetical protein
MGIDSTKEYSKLLSTRSKKWDETSFQITFLKLHMDKETNEEKNIMS